jgi:hypothetical protein
MKKIESTRFIINDVGDYCIEVNNKRSRWVKYDSITILHYDNRIFVGFSFYWNSLLRSHDIYELILAGEEVKREKLCISLTVVEHEAAQEIFKSDMKKFESDLEKSANVYESHTESD